jgi:indole-3-glycerol phosphate synthase
VAAKHARPLSSLLDEIRVAAPVRGFAAALRRAIAEGRWGLIAEVKKASPSHGLIRPDFDPAAIARAYAGAGASCLSVLTDEPYFQGRPEHLAAARSACELPVLRKDFILDPYQVLEARAMGADCILLILASLEDGLAAELEAAAMELDLDVLIEVHDRAELDRALRLVSPLVGINNRNLKTLKTDLQTTVDLAAAVPGDRVLISESGLGTHRDLARMAEAGARCFLVGESLLRHDDVGGATRSLLEGP